MVTTRKFLFLQAQASVFLLEFLILGLQKTGLYATLNGKYGLSCPEQIFDIDTFLEKPEIFYDFAKDFDWTKYNPTPTHYFIKLL